MKFSSIINEYNDRNMSLGDQWLKNYTLNPYDKFPSENETEDLLYDYLYDGKQEIFYRGINFDSEKEYNKFIKNVKNKGIYKIEGIASFSLNMKTARQFALTRPMYLDMMDREDIRNLSERRKMKEKEGERYDGYIGVIIGIKADKKKAIDVNKSEFGKESEILIISGNYKIVFYKEIKRFKDFIKNKYFTADKFLNKLDLNLINKKSIYRNLIEYLVKHNIEISNKAKHSFFLRSLKNYSPNIEHKIEKDYNYGQKPEKKLQIFFNRIPLGLAFFEWLLTENDKNGLKSVIDKLNKDIYGYILNKKLEKYRLYSKRNFDGLEIYGSEWNKKLRNLFNKKIGEKYNKLNSLKEINKINSLNGYEKQQAVKNFINNIENLLKNII